MIPELLRFTCIGLLSLLVHFVAVAFLVPLGLHPLAANLAGFLIAFQVSFWGHGSWTFRARRGIRQYFRLFAVASSGFALNEISYALLLRFMAFDYRLALAIVLAGISFLTYLVSKSWVFRQRTEPDCP